jgi:hypothetical protein
MNGLAMFGTFLQLNLDAGQRLTSFDLQTEAMASLPPSILWLAVSPYAKSLGIKVRVDMVIRTGAPYRL